MTDSNFLPVISTDEIWVGEDKTRCLSGYIDNIIYVSSEDGVEYIATVDSVNELSAGVNFIMVPNMTSTSTAPTLNVNGFGAKYIRQRLSLNSSATVQGSIESWIVEDRPIRVIYDGMYWVVDFTKPDLNYANGVLPVANGGTGGGKVGDARKNLGLGGVGATNQDGTFDENAGPLSIENGGTGCDNLESLKAAIGFVDEDNGIVPISMGGTGAGDADNALTNLGAASNAVVDSIKAVVDPIASVLSVGDDYVDVSKPIRIEDCVTASKTDGLNMYGVLEETGSVSAKCIGTIPSDTGFSVNGQDLYWDSAFAVSGFDSNSGVASEEFGLPANVKGIGIGITFSSIVQAGSNSLSSLRAVLHAVGAGTILWNKPWISLSISVDLDEKNIYISGSFDSIPAGYYAIGLYASPYESLAINGIDTNYDIKYITVTESNKNFSVSPSGDISSSNILPMTSGAYLCGNSNYRWKGIYSTTAVNVSSDERLKENIKPINIDDAIKLINNVDVKSFNYIGDDNIQVGIIAQDIINASPELAEAIVSQGEDGYYGVKTSDIVFPLMAVTQNLMKKVEDLTRRVDELSGQ